MYIKVIIGIVIVAAVALGYWAWQSGNHDEAMMQKDAQMMHDTSAETGDMMQDDSMKKDDSMMQGSDGAMQDEGQGSTMMPPK